MGDEKIEIEDLAYRRKVSVPLAIGIVFAPFIFSWLTLRKGYSTKARGISFGLVVFYPILMISSVIMVAPEPSAKSQQSSMVAPKSCDKNKAILNWRENCAVNVSKAWAPFDHVGDADKWCRCIELKIDLQAFLPDDCNFGPLWTVEKVYKSDEAQVACGTPNKPL